MVDVFGAIKRVQVNVYMHEQQSSLAIGVYCVVVVDNLCA